LLDQGEDASGDVRRKHAAREPRRADIEAKAGAPRADTNVMTDEAARGFLDGIERVAQLLLSSEVFSSRIMTHGVA
jgi:hypothetical protein